MFNLQAHLSNYESSVLIRIIYYVISNPSLNIAGLVSCIKLIDIMGIVGLLILAQKYRIIMILNVFKYIWCTLWIVKGMNSASVYLVINCLKMAFNRRFDPCWYSDSSMAFWLGTNNLRTRYICSQFVDNVIHFINYVQFFTKSHNLPQFISRCFI